MKYLMVLAVGVSLHLASAPGMPGQAKDTDIAFIKEAMEENSRAWKSGNVDVITKYDHPEYSAFPGPGGLLREGGPDKEALRQRIETGPKYDSEYRDLQVRVFGNTGIVTCYVVRRATRPGLEESIAFTNRMTSVWAKENGEWKWVHDHISPLTSE